MAKDPTPANRAALLVGLSHLAFGVLVQCESFFAFLAPRRDVLAAAGTFAARGAVLQGQYIAAAALLALFTALVWRWRLGRWLAVLATLVADGYLLLDQIVFGVFQEHIHPSMSEERLPSLSILNDSLRAEVGVWTAINLALLALLALVLVWPGLRRRAAAAVAVRVARPWQRRSVRWASGAYLLASIAAPFFIANAGLETHPVWSLARPSSESAFRVTDAAAVPPDYALRFGESREDDGAQRQLTRAWQQLEGRRRNVILLLLESVGAEQFLADGGPREERTPFLARLWRQSLTFDSIYVTHPSTQASLLLLHTGGQSITWGLMDPALARPYAGARLADQFRAAGYRTAFMTAGDLSYARTIDDIQGAGYDVVLHAGSLSAAERRRWALNSWGVDEALIFARAREWIESVAASGKPFFLETLTLVTHHPYTVPGGPPPSRDEADAEERYAKALAYTDAQVGALLAALEERGLLEETVIAIAGDHGEGFGRLHGGGRTHGRQVYEETVRTYLALAAPGVFSEPQVSHRIGTMADAGATLAALAGQAPLGSAQNLFSSAYRPRLAYFHSRHEPVRWGLRDGDWKFIGGLGGDDRHVELYDLGADPGEQDNLAAKYPERIAVYAELCRRWYANATPLYLAQLDGRNQAVRGAITLADLSAPGPKSVLIGVDDADFRQLDVIEPQQEVVARSEWVPYGEPKLIRYQWKSPSGRVRSIPVSLDPGMVVKKVQLHTGKKLEIGDWHLSLWDGNRQIFEVSFPVREAPFVVKGDAVAPPRPVGVARRGRRDRWQR